MDVNLSRSVRDLASQLEIDYQISSFEALTLALKVEQNEILKRAFVVSDSKSMPNTTPGALELIAISLQEVDKD